MPDIDFRARGIEILLNEARKHGFASANINDLERHDIDVSDSNLDYIGRLYSLKEIGGIEDVAFMPSAVGMPLRGFGRIAVVKTGKHIDMGEASGIVRRAGINYPIDHSSQQRENDTSTWITLICREENFSYRYIHFVPK